MKGECQVTDTPGGRPRGFGCCKNHQQRHEPFPSCNGANSEQHSKAFAKQDAWYLASSKQHRFPKRTPNPTNINNFWMAIAVRDCKMLTNQFGAKQVSGCCAQLRCQSLAFSLLLQTQCVARTEQSIWGETGRWTHAGPGWCAPSRSR
jgi:hypothetical protein